MHIAVVNQICLQKYAELYNLAKEMLVDVVKLCYNFIGEGKGCCQND